MQTQSKKKKKKKKTLSYKNPSSSPKRAYKEWRSTEDGEKKKTLWTNECS